MPPATNVLQLLSEAVATIIDAAPTVTALTGRASGNIVRWRARKTVAAPRLAYIAGPAEVAGGLGENYEVTLLIRAEAATASAANALVRAATEALTPQAFEAQSCDAVVLETTPDDADDDGDSSNAALVVAESESIVLITLA